MPPQFLTPKFTNVLIQTKQRRLLFSIHPHPVGTETALAGQDVSWSSTSGQASSDHTAALPALLFPHRQYQKIILNCNINTAFTTGVISSHIITFSALAKNVMVQSLSIYNECCEVWAFYFLKGPSTHFHTEIWTWMEIHGGYMKLNIRAVRSHTHQKMWTMKVWCRSEI